MRNRFIKVWPNAFVTIIAGVIGALLVSGLLATGRWLGVSSLQLEEILGVLVTGSAELTYTWAIGFGWHLLNGAFFAFIYAFCFKKLGRGGISTGAALRSGPLVTCFFVSRAFAGRARFVAFAHCRRRCIWGQRIIRLFLARAFSIWRCGWSFLSAPEFANRFAQPRNRDHRTRSCPLKQKSYRREGSDEKHTGLPHKFENSKTYLGKRRYSVLTLTGRSLPSSANLPRRV